MSPPTREQRARDAFVALADTLVDDYDLFDLLDLLIAYSVDLLSADAVGIMLADPRNDLLPIAASDEDARTVELLQLQTDEGPCLECFRTVTQVRVPDLAQMTGHWPRFVTAVTTRTAFASVHAIPLRLRGQAIGTLTLFRRTPGPLADTEIALGQALADVATIGILQERAIRRGEVLNDQLQTALDGRVAIEQAKGVLAHHLGVSVSTAFHCLRAYARSNDLRLAAVAGRLVDGELSAGALSSTARSADTGSTT